MLEEEFKHEQGIVNIAEFSVVLVVGEYWCGLPWGLTKLVQKIHGGSEGPEDNNNFVPKIFYFSFTF